MPSYTNKEMTRKSPPSKVSMIVPSIREAAQHITGAAMFYPESDPDVKALENISVRLNKAAALATGTREQQKEALDTLRFEKSAIRTLASANQSLSEQATTEIETSITLLSKAIAPLNEALQRSEISRT